MPSEQESGGLWQRIGLDWTWLGVGMYVTIAMVLMVLHGLLLRPIVDVSVAELPFSEPTVIAVASVYIFLASVGIAYEVATPSDYEVR